MSGEKKTIGAIDKRHASSSRGNLSQDAPCLQPLQNDRKLGLGYERGCRQGKDQSHRWQGIGREAIEKQTPVGRRSILHTQSIKHGETDKITVKSDLVHIVRRNTEMVLGCAKCKESK